jgi:hypothetical protein
MTRLLFLTVLLVFSSVAFAQEGIEPADKLPTRDLVAWSGMQSPEPVQPAAQGSTPEPSPDAKTDPAVHTVTGSISKEGDAYVLKVSDTTSYKLDDQGKAKEYEGQKVRVTGQVDLKNDQIHVQKIEPLV